MFIAAMIASPSAAVIADVMTTILAAGGKLPVLVTFAPNPLRANR